MSRVEIHTCLPCGWRYQWPLSAPAPGWWSGQSSAGSAERKIPWISPASSRQGSALLSMEPADGLPPHRCPHHHHHHHHLNGQKHDQHINRLKKMSGIKEFSTISNIFGHITRILLFLHILLYYAYFLFSQFSMKGYRVELFLSLHFAVPGTI